MNNIKNITTKEIKIVTNNINEIGGSIGCCVCYHVGYYNGNKSKSLEPTSVDECYKICCPKGYDYAMYYYELGEIDEITIWCPRS